MVDPEPKTPTSPSTEPDKSAQPSSPISQASPAPSNSSLAPAGEAIKEEQDILITKYIQACQSGDIATVKDLIGSGAIELGEDVDLNGVSGLHWASINNRLSIVKYLVEQGAEVDKIGGDLNATPLHWACRYGLVYIVDFLLKAGADPAKTDSQGFNALHLATHSSNVMLVIYLLVFLDTADVDASDPNGRTALHWAAYQGDSLSVDVLLKFNASVKTIDDQGFTPLHWALIRGTRECLKRLIEEGSEILATTNDGKNCFDIAQDMNSTAALQQSLYEAGYQPTGEPIIKRLDEKYAKLMTFLIPYVLVGVMIKILAESHILFSVLCGAILFFSTQKILSKVLFPCYIRNNNALLSSPFLAGVFSASTFWVIITWITRILPATIFEAFFSNLVFAVLACCVVYTFQRSMFRNPGIIEPPESNDTIKESITDLLKLGKYDARHFCVHTFVRRPIRAKYSQFLERVVVRFDHTCPWVYNDIGLRNHKVFLFFVISLEFAVIIFLKLVMEYFDTLEDDGLKCQLFDDEMCAGWTNARFIFILTGWTAFQLIWVTFLLFSQVFQLSKGMTTLELTVLTRHGGQNGGNQYYSSTPEELLGDDAINDIGTQNSTRGHSHGNCLSLYCQVTGLNQFVIAVKQSLGLKNSTQLMEIPTDYGIKQNCMDFWVAAGDDHFDFRNIYKLPVKDEATLNGQVVNYYTMYKLPEKRPVYDSAV